ncbi:MAG: DUF4157 domain-containing protein [Bacteroidia bacterium]|nr:DUF4157 domain-containing protein [Bacteroidia bacterium]
MFAAQQAVQRAESLFFAPVLQPKCEACAEEGQLQAYPQAPPLQRQAEEEEVQAQAEPPAGELLQRQEEEAIQAQAEPPAGEVLQRQAEEEEVQAQAEDAENIQPTPEHQDTGIQPKLRIGAPGDRYEREADAMAERVVNMPEAKASDSLSDNSAQHTSIQRSITPLAAAITPLQRKEAPEEAPEIQAQAEPAALQMTGAADPPPDEGEGSIQRQGEHLPSLSERFAQRLSTRKGSGSPLPDEARSRMEQGFGADFSGVRIHTDSEAVQMSQEAHAQAFTHGNDIYFNAGKFDPASTQGQRLLAHELTHTVQQGGSVMRKEVVPDIQLLGIDTIISAAAWAGVDLPAYARHVPGYTLFTVIAGQDPLTGNRVAPTAENIVGGIMGLAPFGTAIYDKLTELGIVQRALTWIQGELDRCNISLTRIVQTFDRAWAEIEFRRGWEYNLGVLTRHFGALLQDVRNFAASLVQQLMTWVKEALVLPLHARVSQNRWYLLLTKILGQDPITGAEVHATTVEILEEVLRLAGKETELEQMRARGTLQRSADWIDTQLGTFRALLGELRGIFTAAWEAIQPASLPNIAQNFQNLAERFWSFLTRLTSFAGTVAAQVLQFIKDALLGLLREHASSIRGYRLFTVILGRDPVTQQPVERNARNIIAGFMELAAGQEAYQQMEETGAIDRMAAWVNSLIQRYGITVELIRNLFLGIWNSLTVNDLVHPIDAFERVVATFREPIARLLGFALEVIKKLIEVLLELMNFPTELILQIIQRATQAFEDIQRDPVGFLLNLLRAVKQGFIQFFGNIGSHLLSGLVGWLTSELQDAGVSPPRDFSLRGVITFVLDVLGITMERIWQKLAEHPQIGPERVARVRQFLETAGQAATGVWAFIQDVQREGIGAIWRHIQDQLSNLWDTVLDAVKNWIMERIITQMVTRLLSMLDPTGIMAVVNSFIAFYRAVQSFIEKLRQILEVINSFVGGIAEIARGTLATAANFLENTMARSLPVIIGFLANQVGLRGLGARIGEMIGRVRGLVDQALGWLVNRAVSAGRGLLNRVMGGGRRNEPTPPNAVQVTHNLPDVEVSVPFSMGTASHHIYFVSRAGRVEITMASDARISVPLYLAQAITQLDSMTSFRHVDKNRIRARLVSALNKTNDEAVGGYIQDWEMNNFGGSSARNLTQFIREKLLRVVESLSDLSVGEKKIPAISGLFELLNKNTRNPGPYRNEPDLVGQVAPFGEFTSYQRTRILDLNRANHGGTLVSDCKQSEILHDEDPNDPLKANIDHIYPRSKGGSNSYSNAQVLSRQDNLRKSNTQEGCP